VIPVLVATPSAASLDIIERLMVLAKIRVLPGQAPPGHFEDLLQAWLEEGTSGPVVSSSVSASAALLAQSFPELFNDVPLTIQNKQKFFIEH
jgi:hypothetical protein